MVMTLEDKIAWLGAYDGRELRLMEVCGTHTAGIFKSGIRSLLSPKIKLISGPGCPVCVTPAAYIDKCLGRSIVPGNAVASFGDMLKVPGAAVAGKPGLSLAEMRGEGGRVEMIYSPFDVIAMAMAEPDTQFVIAAVGFETTAPAYGLLMDELLARGIGNIKLLTSLRTALPAIEWICQNEPGVDGFLAPGHVSVITGSNAYLPIAKKYGKPFVVGGFEGEHLINAIYELARLASLPGDDALSTVSNLYGEVVSEGGNAEARAVIDKYFDAEDTAWRGLGVIPGSGLYLKQEYEAFDAGSRSKAMSDATADSDEQILAGCRCSDVITGRIDPDKCPLFDTSCRPGHAIGPCMVSSEGACGIWYRNR